MCKMKVENVPDYHHPVYDPNTMSVLAVGYLRPVVVLGYQVAVSLAADQAVDIRLYHHVTDGIADGNPRSLANGDVLRLLIQLGALRPIERDVSLVHKIVVLFVAPSTNVV